MCDAFFTRIILISVFVISVDILTASSLPRIDDNHNNNNNFKVEQIATDDDDARCPKRPVFTITWGGRTANIIWEYVSTLIFARYLPHRQIPYTQHYILDRIVNIFVNTTDMLPLAEDIPADCKVLTEDRNFISWTTPNTPKITIYETYNTEQLIEIYRRYSGNIVVNMYAMYLETIVRNIDYVKRNLRYLPEFIDYSDAKFKAIKSTYMKRKHCTDCAENITFVGIHVRRTDYLNHIRNWEHRDEVGADYFKAAMQYFRDRKSEFGTPLFVVISDEKDWVEEKLSGDDVFIAASGDIVYATSDLALFSLCNHSIIDYGTYGWWGAVYANGHVISVQYKGDQVYAFLRNNPKWHLVDVNRKPIVIP